MISNIGLGITVIIGLVIVVANVVDSIKNLARDLQELKAEEPLYKQIRKLKEKGKWE